MEVISCNRKQRECSRWASVNSTLLEEPNRSAEEPCWRFSRGELHSQHWSLPQCPSRRLPCSGTEPWEKETGQSNITSWNPYLQLTPGLRTLKHDASVLTSSSPPAAQCSPGWPGTVGTPGSASGCQGSPGRRFHTEEEGEFRAASSSSLISQHNKTNSCRGSHVNDRELRHSACVHAIHQISLSFTKPS